MKLDSDPFPVNMIEFQNKKMLIRADQAESAKDKNVVDDDAPPRMIKPKNPEVGVWKVNGKKKQVTRPKPTVNMLFEKYTSRKTNNVFSRLGGVKRPRSCPRYNNEHWGRGPYELQPGFPIQPAYWGCSPPMPPHFPPWDFNTWAPFPMGPPGYFQLGWGQPNHAYQEQHEKRIRFDRDIVRRDRSPEHEAGDRAYAGCKLTWVRKDALGKGRAKGRDYGEASTRRVAN